MAPKPHWLAPGGATKTPSIVISFDTETTEVQLPGHSAMTLRCWDAKVRHRHRENGRADRRRFFSGERASELAGLVESQCEDGTEVWVVAHNVSFDLAVTSLPFILVDREWQLDGVHLGDESTWWVLKKGRRKIVITDSWSWMRCSLAEAAKDIKRRKVDLPDNDGTLEEWHHRCRVDADILDQLFVTLLDWWDANHLGVFGITGAACGWRAMRSIIKPKTQLVGPEQPRTLFERAAVFGGRKEVYGVGEFHDTWIADYDFNNAYATTAAAWPLPVTSAKLWRSSAALLDEPPPPQRDYIAEVEITTKRPCAPCRIAGEIWWPVGTFRTVLCGPEVRYAATVAESVTVIRHEAYRTGFALAEWAAWVIELQDPNRADVPALVARVAKGWGRSVLGRFASRTSHVISTRPSTHLGWHLETGHDLDTGAALEWLSIGGVEQCIAKDIDGADCFPAVLAFVESYTRVALATMLDSRDPSKLLQCNTDGWWESNATRRSDYVPEDVPWPHRIVRKALERRLLVRGPNHVMSPHERRYAGIPAASIDLGDGVMKWQDWPGLRWQLEHGVTGQYHRPDREAVLAEHYVRRWVLTTGETVPVTCRVDETRSTLIEPWQRSMGQRDADILVPYQVPTLAALLDSDRDQSAKPLSDLPTQPGRDFPSPPRGAWLSEPVSDERYVADHTPPPAQPTLLGIS